MRSLTIRSCLVMVFLAVGSGLPLAATIYVDDDAPSDPDQGDPSISDPLEDGSATHPFDAIQEGINAAADGDEVVILDGTYTGNGNRDIDFLGKTITVQSENGADNCIIDCEFVTASDGFYFHSGEGTDSVVDGFTIMNADYKGIRCLPSSSPTISNNTIIGNGDGIFCYDGSSSPTIINNTISGSGDGIHCGSSSTVISDNMIIGNTGGGIWCPYYSSPAIISNTISGNFVLGIYCDDSSPIITNCVVWDNSSHEIVGGTPTVTYSCVENGYPGMGNISVDPLFVDQGHWDDNGTPNNSDDFWVDGDFHLLPTSPCIDAGSFVADLLEDFDGDPRGFNGSSEPRGDGSDFDMGADEYVAEAYAGDDAYGYESRGTQTYQCQLNSAGSRGVSTYLWEQLSGIPVVLDNPASPSPTFSAPQWDGSTELTKTQATLTFRLTINQGEVTEYTDEVAVYIRIPGDANGDDAVNAFDVALLRLSDPSADFNGDGFTNATDISILRQNTSRRRTVD